MLEIHKKWIIFAIGLLLLSGNHFRFLCQLSDFGILAFFMIPSLIWLNDNTNQYNNMLSFGFSIIVILGIIIFFISGGGDLIGDTKCFRWLPNSYIKPTLITVHIVILLWAMMYILPQFSISYQLPQAYIILSYSAFILYIIITQHGNYPFFLNTVLNFMILNSVYIAIYYLFNLNLTFHYVLALPFYMILFGIAVTLYFYILFPNKTEKFNYNILLYICSQFIIFVTVVLISIKSYDIKLNTYHYIALMCCITFLINNYINYLTMGDLSLITFFGDELKCCVIAFLFNIIPVRNKILINTIMLLSIIIITIQIMTHIGILGLFYKVIEHDAWLIDFSTTPSMISNLSFQLLILILLISTFYTMFNNKTEITQAL